MYYLNSFKPICHFKQGRAAVRQFNLPPCIDASCRREPDFQSRMPSISALCRGKMFAPRLQEGDRVIYMTVKGSYESEASRHWRLVAILQVIHRFESHKEAAAWYVDSGLPLPSNCMVDENLHLPYEMTGGTSPKRFGNVTNLDGLVRKWDLLYRVRARKCGVFLACRADFLELERPPMLTDEVMLNIFGRIPPTLTPPPITRQQHEALSKLTT